MLRMVSRIFDIRPGEGMRTVVTGPVYHSAPNMYALSAARDGGLVVLQPRFDAEDLLRQVERHRITHLHMVPTMFGGCSSCRDHWCGANTTCRR